MRTLKYIACIISAIFALSMLDACHSGGGDEPTPDPPLTKGTHTVLVYMVADNSMSAFDESDIAEMQIGFADASINPALHKLLIYVDDYSANPTIYQLVKGADGTVTKEVYYEYPADHDSASPTVIEEVIDKVYDAFPAEKYGFIYWSHGEGWVPYPMPTKSIKPRADYEMKWIGIDVTRTEISDLAAALSSVGKKLDFLMFDACYMLSTEVAYELRNVADYIVSSPTEIPGPGAPYDIIVPKMFGTNAAVNIAKSYYDYYAATYDEEARNTNTRWTGGVSVGTLKAAEIENFAKATKEAVKTVGNYDFESLQQGLLNYDRRSTTSASYVGYYDMAQMMEQLLSPSAYTTWRRAFDAMVVEFSTTPKNFTAFTQGLFSMEGAQGLSIYMPREISSTNGVDAAYRATSWYKAAGLDALGW